MNRIVLSLFVTVLLCVHMAAGAPWLSLAEQRASKLLARMTLQEKVGQLVQYSFDENRIDWFLKGIRNGRIGSLTNANADIETANRLQRAAVEETRLGIPLIYGNDVIHGFKTIFPIPLAGAASWDPRGVEETCRAAALEASAAGSHWTFAPMVDIARDPRWGRIAEGAGEDPVLGMAMARARVRGFQGSALDDTGTILACAKHYVAYGAARAGRDYNTVDVSEQSLYEIYLPPFHAAVTEGVGTLMTAFNDLNGVPATGNRFTLNRILRGTWGFEGFVVSDFNSIAELMIHRFATDSLDAAQKALYAGVDMDMQSHVYDDHLAALVQQERIPESWIDTAVHRILTLKFALGLFDNPYADPVRARELTMSPDHLDLARHAAARSMVLLRNETDLLPLDPDIESIAVIGPLADNQHDLLGSWHMLGEADPVITVLAGIRSRVSDQTRVEFVAGCSISGETTEGFARAVRTARNAEVAVMVVGESGEMSGEARCRTRLDLPGMQKQLIQAVYETGTPVVVVLINGRPLAIEWTAAHVPAILEAWQPGTSGGAAIADVLFGRVNPGGKLPVTAPRSVGHVPLFYNHKSTGRPPDPERKFSSKYLDSPVSPLFPFGFGLSYTTFELSDLQLSDAKIGTMGTLEVQVDVTNTGRRAGDEVVQLYIQDKVSSRTRPVRELKAFQRVSLDPGGARTLRFNLGPKDLQFYHPVEGWIVEPGEFLVWASTSSLGGLETSFQITE